MLHQDFTELVQNTDDDFLCSYSKLHDVYEDQLIREAFVKVDLKVLTSKHKTVCIPPPGWTPTGAMQAAQAEVPITMKRLICDLPLPDGNTCKEEFSNMIKLRAHRTTATVHRNVFPRPYNLVVNNVCPWCMTVCNKKNAAQSMLQELSSKASAPPSATSTTRS